MGWVTKDTESYRHFGRVYATKLKPASTPFLGSQPRLWKLQVYEKKAESLLNALEKLQFPRQFDESLDI